MITAPGLQVDKTALLALYRQMVEIRRTEEQLAKSHQAGAIPGACHTYIGQEAVAAGVCAHLRADDVVFSTHRGHGHALAKGVAPREPRAWPRASSSPSCSARPRACRAGAAAACTSSPPRSA